MLLSTIYQNVHSILSKDGNEGLISIPRWNSLLHSVQYELIREEATKNSVMLENGNDQLLSLRILKQLVTIKEGLTPTTLVASTSIYVPLTSASLGSEMLYWGNMWTSTGKKVDLVTFDQFINKFSNFMAMNIDENPIAYINYRSSTLEARIYPASITSVSLMFIRKPTTPKLDYYMDANYKTQFMAAGASHLLTANEQYSDGTTTGTKVSTTVELDIPDDYHPKFQDMMVERLSLPIDDQYKNQYSLAKEKQA